jgi:tRNA-2-methylthio-N6-dimethylallyladenosine synthase
LQSGSDRVLAAMRRGYTVRRYLDRLARARAAIPDLAVTTDVIVGFPGETDNEFDETLAVVAEAGYDGAFTFIFSPRSGTRAAEMVEDFVTPDVIAERFARLKAVVDRSALQRNRARVGRVEEVVVEGPSRKDARVLAGRTRQGKLVHFDPGAEPMARGSYGTVRITSAGPHHLAGDLESREGPDASRRRRPSIPVAAS